MNGMNPKFGETCADAILSGTGRVNRREKEERKVGEKWIVLC